MTSTNCEYNSVTKNGLSCSFLLLQLAVAYLGWGRWDAQQCQSYHYEGEAKALGIVLGQQEENSDQAVHLSQKRAIFGPLILPCHCTAPEWSLAWHGGIAEWCKEREAGRGGGVPPSLPQQGKELMQNSAPCPSFWSGVWSIEVPS